MGSIFKPKMPSPPPLPDPPEPDFSYEDQARQEQAEKDAKRRNLNRTGRRATILTGSGLTDIKDENLDKKTLLG